MCIYKCKFILICIRNCEHIALCVCMCVYAYTYVNACSQRHLLTLSENKRIPPGTEARTRLVRIPLQTQSTNERVWKGAEHHRGGRQGTRKKSESGTPEEKNNM